MSARSKLDAGNAAWRAGRGAVSRSLFFKLFTTFLLVVAVAFAVEAWLAIVAGRGAMGRLVEDDLRGRARDVLEEVDQYLAGRVREVELWSGLSVMNEAASPEDARRVQGFLETLFGQKSDQYVALSVLDASGRVLASTDKKTIGTRFPLFALATRTLAGHDMRIGDFPAASPGSQGTLLIAYPAGTLPRAEAGAWLVAEMRWNPVERIVSRAQLGRCAQDSGRFLLLADHGGRVIAGSRAFLEQLPGSIARLGTLRPRDSTKQALILGPYLVAESELDHPESPLGPLRTVAFWKTSEAYAVVTIFVVTVLGSAVLGMALAAGASFFVARTITRRLGRLTEGTARLARGEMDYRVEEGPHDEIGRLARSFNVMATIITTDMTHRKRLEREILEVSELERKRIGQDLHDGLGQVLTGTALLIKGLQQRLLKRSLPEATDAGLIKDLIGAALDQTRMLAKGLFPVRLQDEGLRGALEDLAAGVDHMFRVSCSVHGELESPPPDLTKATHLFRIAQEAVSNSIRHGRARRIIIELSSVHGGNFIRIKDDGVGIVKINGSSEGMGLRSMKYRAGVIGGTIEIGPAPGRGTIVTCHFQ